MRPVLVGVDGGADAILEAGLKPDLILGDMDSASDEALRCGAELIVHAYPDGRAPGRDAPGAPRPGAHDRPRRRDEPGRRDAARLEKGAALIVSVGAHFNLVEFLDKDARRDVLDLPDPASDRRDAGRRQGREPALQPRRRAAARWRSCSVALLILLAIVVVTSPALSDLVDLIWLKIKIILGIS